MNKTRNKKKKALSDKTLSDKERLVMKVFYISAEQNEYLDGHPTMCRAEVVRAALNEYMNNHPLQELSRAKSSKKPIKEFTTKPL